MSGFWLSGDGCEGEFTKWCSATHGECVEQRQGPDICACDSHSSDRGDFFPRTNRFCTHSLDMEVLHWCLLLTALAVCVTSVVKMALMRQALSRYYITARSEVRMDSLKCKVV
jgi:hypothetical protein